MMNLIQNFAETIPLRKHKTWGKRLRIAAIISGIFAVAEFISFFDLNREQSFFETLIFFVIFGLICLGAILTMSAMRQQRDRSRMLLGRIKGEDKLSIKELAKTFDTSQNIIIKDFQNLIRSGDIKDWYADLNQQRFFNRSAYPENVEKVVIRCPNCGGDNVVIKGQITSCTYCKAPLDASK